MISHRRRFHRTARAIESHCWNRLHGMSVSNSVTNRRAPVDEMFSTAVFFWWRRPFSSRIPQKRWFQISHYYLRHCPVLTKGWVSIRHACMVFVELFDHPHFVPGMPGQLIKWPGIPDTERLKWNDISLKRFATSQNYSWSLSWAGLLRQGWETSPTCCGNNTDERLFGCLHGILRWFRPHFCTACLLTNSRFTSQALSAVKAKADSFLHNSANSRYSDGEVLDPFFEQEALNILQGCASSPPQDAPLLLFHICLPSHVFA